MRLKALRTFKVGDTNKVVNIGDEFESKNGAHYEKLGMATPVHGIPQPAAAKEPPAPGPLPRAGGATGAAPLLSSSLQAPAPTKRPYTKRGAKRES